MKFLSKNKNSKILEEGLTYQKNRAGNNKSLKMWLYRVLCGKFLCSTTSMLTKKHRNINVFLL